MSIFFYVGSALFLLAVILVIIGFAHYIKSASNGLLKKLIFVALPFILLGVPLIAFSI